MDWKDYPGDRLIAEHAEGFYVIKQKGAEIHDPVFCPLCSFIMKTVYDDEAHRKFGCCDSCASNWAYPNLDKWKSGWRPAPEVVNNSKKRPI